MKQFYKFLRSFFMTLGVIFFVLLIVLAYLFVADPFNLRPLYTAFTTPSSTAATSTSSIKTTNPLLTPAQEKALIKIGVDPAKLPTTITPQMAACFVQKLGQKRADQIKNGAVPTAADYFAARSCL